ncbi:cupredoxin domain-containing protein [Longimicrobium sp.]|uniref:cupredoxin domain-containing protein n=1 Tax=Longimicrobium sp. TaxID=2029185 RepID=UPI002C50AAF4|nr:plastocyanin/azurin family copper-binding protein [Longimicrobium sp.]HSU17955.1 plastocyanin/azurin family copper-binding protein [Longimicrobium sp.]
MRAPLVLACVVMIAACGGGNGSGNNYNGGPTGPNNPPPNNSTATVNATPSLAFTPDSVAVNAGENVTFAFGSVAHTVTFQQGVTNPGDYGGVGSTGNPPSDIPETQNTSVTRTFATPGVYHYRCSIHTGMFGTVVAR